MEKKCTDYAYCFLEPDDDFCCGHPTAGIVGKYVNAARKPGGICGPDATLFEPRVKPTGG
jgi:hypothetical protein